MQDRQALLGTGLTHVFAIFVCQPWLALLARCYVPCPWLVPLALPGLGCVLSSLEP